MGPLQIIKQTSFSKEFLLHLEEWMLATLFQRGKMLSLMRHKSSTVWKWHVFKEVWTLIWKCFHRDKQLIVVIMRDRTLVKVQIILIKSLNSLNYCVTQKLIMFIVYNPKIAQGSKETYLNSQLWCILILRTTLMLWTSLDNWQVRTKWNLKCVKLINQLL